MFIQKKTYQVWYLSFVDNQSLLRIRATRLSKTHPKRKAEYEMREDALTKAPRRQTEMTTEIWLYIK